MNCEQTSELLNAYLDRELRPEARAKVRGHLHACASCTKALEGLRRLNRAIESIEATAVPEGFARRVRLAAESTRIVRPEPAGRPASIFTGALARAAAVLVAVAGLSVGLAMGRTLGGANGLAAAAQAADDDLLSLQLDALTAAPTGSMGEMFLAFTTEPEQGVPDGE